MCISAMPERFYLGRAATFFAANIVSFRGLIGQIDVSDPDGYAKEYLPKAREIIKAHGGRLIAAAGAAATGSQVVAIDGEAPKRVVIYMYPNMEALQAWRNDPAYVQVRRGGEKYAKYHTFAVEGAAGNSP